MDAGKCRCLCGCLVRMPESAGGQNKVLKVNFAQNIMKKVRKKTDMGK